MTILITIPKYLCGVYSVVSTQLSAFCATQTVNPYFPNHSSSCFTLSEARREVKIKSSGSTLHLASSTPHHTWRRQPGPYSLSFSTRKLLTHPALPSSHTQDALVPQVVRNRFGLCWRRGPQRNWMRQCEAASITFFGSCICLALPLFWFGEVFFFFSFFFNRSEFLKWDWHRKKADSKIWILMVHWPGQLRFKSNFEKFEHLLHAIIHLELMGMADLHLCFLPNVGIALQLCTRKLSPSPLWS